MRAAGQIQVISSRFSFQIERAKELAGIRYQQSDRGEPQVARNRVVTSGL